MRAIALACCFLALGCGGPWERADVPTTANLNALFGFSATDVWAAGDTGTVLHFDGQSWVAVETGTNSDFTCLWGSKPDDVWISGGTTRHWNGRVLETVPALESQSVTSIAGDGAGTVVQART